MFNHSLKILLSPNPFKQSFLSVAVISSVFGGLISSSAYAQSKLEEVVITSSRVETPVRQIGASVSIVDAAEIQARGYQNVADVLRTLPSVAVSNSGGAGKSTAVRIRGEESYRTLMLIDGLEMSDPTGTQVMTHFEHFGALGNVERIEVLRGPQGFVYGADTGGVVNVITRKAEGTAASLSFERGTFDTQTTEGFLAVGGEQGDVFVSLSDQSTDGFNAKVPNEDDDRDTDEDGYKNRTFHTKVGWGVSDSVRVQVVLRDTDATSEYDGCFNSNDCVNSVSFQGARLSLEHNSEHFKQTVAVSRTGSDRQYFTNGASGYASKGNIEKTEYVAAYTFSPEFTWVWGGDYESQFMKGGTDDQRSQVGIFTEAQAQLKEQWHFSVGARFDDNKVYGKHTSVRLSPTYIQTLSSSQIKYRASFGTGYRAPSLSELAYNLGPYASESIASAELKEESSQGADVGVDVYFDSGLSFSLGYFDQQIEDEIVFEMENDAGYYTAQGISHSKGVELSVIYPVRQWLSISSNVTKNETLTAQDDVRARRPKLLGNVTLHFSLLDDALQFLVNARTARKRLDNGGVILPDYTVVDFNGTFNVSQAVQVTARIENINDKEYVEVNDYNTAGRTVYAGVRYAF